jgi:hypothetical protein
MDENLAGAVTEQPRLWTLRLEYGEGCDLSLTPSKRLPRSRRSVLRRSVHIRYKHYRERLTDKGH